MINNVTLVGRLTKDPELKYTPSNVAVATFTLAVNRNFKGAKRRARGGLHQLYDVAQAGGAILGMVQERQSGRCDGSHPDKEL